MVLYCSACECSNSEVYIIEKIIRKNKNKYLVKWRGYPMQIPADIAIFCGLNE